MTFFIKKPFQAKRQQILREVCKAGEEHFNRKKHRKDMYLPILPSVSDCIMHINATHYSVVDTTFKDLLRVFCIRVCHRIDN
jgi:hypothetical protein